MKFEEIFRNPVTPAEALMLIQQDQYAYDKYLALNDEFRKQAIDFLCGDTLISPTYDAVFKRLFSAEIHPNRLSDFLSCIIGQQIEITASVPPEGIRLTEKSPFVIMDVLAQTKEKKIMNLEMQKIGYQFTGERVDCYLSDLLMRQYTRTKNECKDEQKFDYKMVSPVHMIILMEKSSTNFKESEEYKHNRLVYIDSGVKVNTLQNATFITLDTFMKKIQNKEVITDKLEAWLLFLSSTEKKDVEKVCHAFPEFIEIYLEINQYRQDVKETMLMLSETLATLDYYAAVTQMKTMCEELQQEIDETKDRLDETKGQLDETKGQLDETKGQLDETKGQLDETKGQLDETKGELDETKTELDAIKQENERLKRMLLEKGM